MGGLGASPPSPPWAAAARDVGTTCDNAVTMASTTKAQLAAEVLELRKALALERAKTAEAEKKLSEALEQQAATSEILRVLSSSPTDIQPVFDAIAHNAVRLCDDERQD